MSISDLLRIADGKAVISSVRVNVRTDPKAAPLMRRLTRVVRQEMNGEQWLYWYWSPEPTGDVNGVDCGYSGPRLSEAA